MTCSRSIRASILSMREPVIPARRRLRLRSARQLRAVSSSLAGLGGVGEDCCGAAELCRVMALATIAATTTIADQMMRVVTIRAVAFTVAKMIKPPTTIEARATRVVAARLFTACLLLLFDRLRLMARSSDHFRIRAKNLYCHSINSRKNQDGKSWVEQTNEVYEVQ